MIKIPFAVNPNASACITTPITIEQALLNEGHIPITTFDGIFSVMSALGDVSLNGTVTGYDAALVLQYTVKLIALTDCQQNAADVDISGEITAYDAAMILQYVVGRISSLPAKDALGLGNRIDFILRRFKTRQSAKNRIDKRICFSL